MRNKIIAITGGIGSGKSTVINLIEKHGYPVISADETYKKLLEDKEFVRGVHLSVGLDVDSPVLLREEVSKIVFNNAEKLKDLNSFTHKKIMEKMFEESVGKRVVFHEVPLLFESGYQDRYDRVLIVKRSKNLRIEGLKIRGLSIDEINKRIENQIDYEKIDGFEHTVIINDGSLEELSAKVKAVLNEILD